MFFQISTHSKSVCEASEEHSFQIPMEWNSELVEGICTRQPPPPHNFISESELLEALFAK